MALDIGKLLLVGGAAFVGYKFFMEPKAVASTPPPDTAGIKPAVGASPATTASLVQAAAAKDGFTLGNVWQWDYYYKSVRGVDANLADKIEEDQRMKNLTFPEWWSIAQANGLSGFRGVGYVRTSRLMAMEME